MKLKKIENEAEYQAALAYAESLMSALPGTPEEDDLKTIAVLIEAYEDEQFPMGFPDPIAAIEFRMEQQGLTRQDLVPYIGSLSKVSEVLNGKRALSKEMIRKLHEGLGIPAELLLGRSAANSQPLPSALSSYPAPQTPELVLRERP
jgi:HTH-type transcriptional regulator/antitoxin HigA